MKCVDQHGVVETSAVVFHVCVCVCAQNIRDHENKQNEKGRSRGIKQKVTMYMSCKISPTNHDMDFFVSVLSPNTFSVLSG